MNKPEYTFSDLVHIAGYGARIFKIDSYRVEQCYSPTETWTDIVYDLIDTETGAYVECDEEDMRLADGEADGNDLGDTGIDIFDFMGGYLSDEEIDDSIHEARRVDSFLKNFGILPSEGVFNMAAKEPRKLTQRELSSQEAARRKQARKDQAAKVDALLDDYNDAKVLAEMFPEDDEYKAKVEYLTVKLAEASVEK